MFEKEPAFLLGKYSVDLQLNQYGVCSSFLPYPMPKKKKLSQSHIDESNEIQ